MKKIFKLLRHIDTTTICVYIGGIIGLVTYITVYFVENPLFI